MKYISLLFVLFARSLFAQVPDKDDSKTLEEIKKIVRYLAADKLEGRRTGTAGEKLAYEFITDKFKSAGLTTVGLNRSFIQEFEVKDGREIKQETVLYVHGKPAKINVDYFPLAFSGNITALKFSDESQSGVTYYDLHDVLEINKTNPHFDLKENIYTAAKKAETDRGTLFVIYNSSNTKDDFRFDAKDKSERLKIPVIFITDKSTFTGGGSLTIDIAEKIKYGHNVVGYIDNNAASTIILGAHYDHLGYGEDHNSLYSGSTPMIHNGADDNASGVSALILLGKWLKNSILKKYNYAFVAFSGEELGLYGSKYFTEHSPIDFKTVNYMLNMDMVGRLNDSTHAITIGGYGTSPTWGALIKKDDDYFKLKLDSSGTGPSDHTSFYKKEIPVLFFFTGAHSDYHKPTDDADKINFAGELAIIKYIWKLLIATDQTGKLSFTKTRDATIGRSSFRVTLGIMPDYTFDGNGVRVDGVSENRPAQKAGIKTGDVIYQLGEHPFNDVETYMQTLNKFNKGDATKVKLKRGTEEMEMEIVF